MGEWYTSCPRCCTPVQEAAVAIEQEAGWDPVLVWIGTKKISPHQHSNPPDMQPVASRFTAYVDLALLLNGTLLIYTKVLTFIK